MLSIQRRGIVPVLAFDDFISIGVNDAADGLAYRWIVVNNEEFQVVTGREHGETCGPRYGRGDRKEIRVCAHSFVRERTGGSWVVVFRGDVTLSRLKGDLLLSSVGDDGVHRLDER